MLEKVWGTGVQGDVVKDYVGTLVGLLQVQQDSAVALWVEDEEVQSLVGDGAPLGERDRQPDCGRDGKAEVVQENPAVGLGCAEMVEGCSAALLHPQEVLKDSAAAAGDLDVGEPGRNRCLSLQTGLVQTAEMDLVIQD